MKTISFALQNRDIFLLNRICQVGYLTINQASLHVFNTSYKYASKRLSKLQANDLLTSTRRRDASCSRVYMPRLTNIRGLVSDEDWCKAERATELKTKPWERLTVDHEDLARDWALRILNMTGTNVDMDYSINEAQWGYFSLSNDANRKVPDFVLHFKDGTKIAFEIELHPKATAIYQRIIKTALARQNCPVVYLTRTAQTKKKIQSILDKVLLEYSKLGKSVSSRIAIKEFLDVTKDDQVLSLIDFAKGLNDGESDGDSSSTGFHKS